MVLADQAQEMCSITDITVDHLINIRLNMHVQMNGAASLQKASINFLLAIDSCKIYIPLLSG